MKMIKKINEKYIKILTENNEKNLNEKNKDFKEK